MKTKLSFALITILVTFAAFPEQEALLASIPVTKGSLRLQSDTGRVSGLVRKPDGSPANGVRVMAMDANLSTAIPVYIAIAKSDNSGHYQLDQIPPGRYYVLAGQIEGPTYYPGVTDRAKATILTVTSGDVSEVQDFVLARMSLEYKVSGHVKRPQGDNSALLGSVLLTRETLDPMPLRTSVANDGSFELLNVPPGDYSAKVQVVSGTMLAVSVHVIDSDIDGIELLVPRQLDIKGRVVTKGSEAIPQLFFRFEPDAFGMVAGPVPLKPDGTFELRIPEGIRFTFVGFPPAYAIESVTYGSQNLLKEPLVKGDGEMIVTFGPALRR